MEQKNKKFIIFGLLIILVSLSVFVTQIKTSDAGLISSDKYQNINQNVAKTGGGIWGVRTKADLYVLVGSIIKIILGLVGVAFFIYFLYGSYIWMTAAGNDTKISTAKKILVNAIIGVILTSFAYVLAYFITVYIETGSTSPGGSGDSPKGTQDPGAGTDIQL